MKKILLFASLPLLFTACVSTQAPQAITNEAQVSSEIVSMSNSDRMQESSASISSQTQEVSSCNAIDKTSSLTYKKSFYGGEIPSTWSHVYLGDVVPLPYSENTWMDRQYIQYSFGSRNVAFGDTNWTQADFAMMNMNDMSRWVSFLKNSKEFHQYVQTWTQETIDGKIADVVTLKTEADGTVSKAGTGGKMYFIHDIGSNPDGAYGFIISKQALGDEEFENGFAHYMNTLDFESGPFQY